MKDASQLYLRLLSWVKPYWRTLLISLLAMAVASAMQPLLPVLLQRLVDEGLIAKEPLAALRLPFWILLTFIVKSLAEYAANVSSQWVANKAVEDLRRAAFHHQMQLPLSAHHAEQPGRMLSRITYDIPQVSSAMSSAWIVVVQDSLTVVALLGYLLWQSWQLAAIMLLIGPIVAWIIRVASRKLRSSNAAMQESMGQMTGAVEESLAGLREIKVFGTQDFEDKRFVKISERLRKETMRVVRVSAANVPLVQVLAAAAVVAVIYAATQLAAREMLTTGSFISFVTALSLLFEPIRRLTNINAVIQRGLAGAQSIFGLLDTPPEADRGAPRSERARGDLRFESVSFTYPGQDKPAVQDFNLHISPGQTVAFVGASGSGKTTLMSLVARFYDVQQGAIRLDGTALPDYALADLRRQIALVGQHAALFDDSVAANIAYGREDTSRDAIEQAARHAHAWEFISALPQGLDTRIGPNGSLLSGGQRQRLAIARAFLKDAPVLLLDEATSALDNESERVVREALVELRKARTVLVVAHRLSTIRDAHCIVVMERGRIVETGTHDMLAAAGGAYARLLASGEELVAD
ncbi:MAG: lipid A export permease/ATP-binding protein MsbA [Moraxellaceae bacterium]|nr:lipid A export permease/ATP-binding protein MsbA [Moraxellaceae bacterium]